MSFYILDLTAQKTGLSFIIRNLKIETEIFVFVFKIFLIKKLVNFYNTIWKKKE